jgi:hypothetical protein
MLVYHCVRDNNIECPPFDAARKEIIRLNNIIAEYEKPKTKSDMKDIKIYLKSGKVINFVGVYRRDLEKDNWHYYETNTGSIIHCRKENMECVEECGVYIKTEDF